MANTRSGFSYFGSGTSFVATGVADLPAGDAARSVFAWVFFEGSSTGYYDIFDYGRIVDIDPDQNKSAQLVVNDGKLYFGGNGNDVATSLSVTPGEWHLVGYTYEEGSTQVTLYVDGQAETGELSAGKPLNTVVEESGIGGQIHIPAATWAGGLTNLQVYDTALSDAEVAHLFLDGKSGEPTNSTNLVSWWQLTSDFRDSGAGRNHGTATDVDFYVILRDGGDQISFNPNSDFRGVVGGNGEDSVSIALSADALRLVTDEFNYIAVLDSSGMRKLRLAEVETLKIDAAGLQVDGELDIKALTYSGDQNGNLLDAGLLETGQTVDASGGAGDDTMIAGAANDLLDGGLGSDFLVGGLGSDTYIVDRSTDIISEQSDSGIDRVEADCSYDLTENLENLELLGIGNFNAVGNELDNSITGNSGDNLIDGGTGKDTLMGGEGNDTYVIDDLGDVVAEYHGGGVDTLRISIFDRYRVNISSAYFVENVVSQTSACLSIKGNALSNMLVAGQGRQSIDGGFGSDTLRGGSGKDAFVFSSALGGDNIDRILDFKPVVDVIKLDHRIFSGLDVGGLDESQFSIGTQALTDESRIIYDAATGGLYFDLDGSGLAPQVQFSTLASGLALTFADFIVY